MSGRDWRGDLAFGLALLAVLIGGGVGFVALWNEQPNATEKAQYAAREQAQRDDVIASCYHLPFDRQKMCVYQAFQAERDANRAEEDLGAQQYMAKASFWLWFIGFAQALAAVGGIYYIARTLDLTADTARAAVDANDLARGSRRPWLSVKVSNAQEDFLMRDEFAADIDCSIENMGQLPAVNTSIRCEVIPVRRRHDANEHFKKFVEDAVVSYDPREIRDPIIIFPGRDYSTETPEMVDCKAPAEFRRPPKLFQFNICVCYHSPQHAETFHTAAAFVLSRKSEYLSFLDSEDDTRYLTREMTTLKSRPLRVNSIS